MEHGLCLVHCTLSHSRAGTSFFFHFFFLFLFLISTFFSISFSFLVLPFWWSPNKLTLTPLQQHQRTIRRQAPVLWDH